MSAQNWNLPAAAGTDTVAVFIAALLGRDISAMSQMRSNQTADTNLVSGMIRWNDTNFNWESWSGSAWAALATTYGISINGNAATATLAGNATNLGGVAAASYALTSALSAYATTSSLSAYATTSSLSAYATLASPALTGNATIDSIKIGYRNVPQNAQSAGYTLVLTDAGKHIYGTNAGAQAIIIPTNASVAFALGDAITFFNNGTTAMSFTTTSLTVYKAGTSAAWASGGTLAVRGLCTFMKVATDTWVVSGSGLS
jgi:hypothetical protein